jgi:lysophospholipase
MPAAEHDLGRGDEGVGSEAGREFLNAVSSHWQARDGTRFPLLKWGNPETARAVVVFVHGLGGSPSDFEPLGESLAEMGIAGYAVTVRGEGLDPDPSRRGKFMNLAVIAEDLSSFASEVHLPGKPFFLCGESLGAMLCAWCLAHEVELPPLRGAVFSAPVVTLSRETPQFVRLALRILARLVPDGRLKPSWFVSGTSKLPPTSRDEAWLMRQRTGPQHIPAFSFGVLHAVGQLMESMPDVAKKISLPCLVLAAGQDCFIRAGQVRAWFDLLASREKTYIEYPESYHVLWNDLGREKVLADIRSWFENRL